MALLSMTLWNSGWPSSTWIAQPIVQTHPTLRGEAPQGAAEGGDAWGVWTIDWAIRVDIGGHPRIL